MQELTNNVFWQAGPEWLSKNESEWPVESDIAVEMDKNEEIIVNAVNEKVQVIDCTRFSRWTRLKRATAWVFRFITNLRTNDKIKGELTGNEIIKGEQYWIGHLQELNFAQELKCLHEKKMIEKSSVLAQMAPILDEDGLMRATHRWTLADVERDVREPYVLPSNNYVTKLIVKDEHKRAMHGGLTDTLCNFRERFWMTRARKTIKAVLCRCVRCRKIQGRLAKERWGLLPLDRVTPSAPFETCGVDFAGPLYSDCGEKLYIALFTCAVTRAVHLELLSNLSADRFVDALKRFIGRRGIPATIYSDNAKTFKRTDKELRVFFENVLPEQLQRFLSSRKIVWKFIVEIAPWWGGFWERMVRSVKAALKKTIGRTSLNYEGLTTVLIEVEAVINSRPLTYVYDGPTEQPPLTPAHFLVGKRLISLPDVPTTANKPEVQASILRVWKRRQIIIDHFWRRWTKEYLVELRQQRGNSSDTKFRVGDLVLIEDQHQPRLTWKRGRITDVKVGRDGLIRSCELQLPNRTKLRRPIQRLCNLEVEFELERPREGGTVKTAVLNV